jgi:tryptophan 7-halogenase
MSSRVALTEVVVLGRDIQLWLTVGCIARALGPAGVKVVAIELPTRLHRGHISATQPPLEALHARLGIEEAELLRITGGSFSLGQNFVGLGPGFFHAWAAYGAPIDGQGFLPCWLKATRQGLNLALRNFCLTAVAAQNGRMLVPDEATAAFGRTDYGYHFQTWAYVGYLKSLAAKLGVEYREARTVGTERAADGSIAALLVDGVRVAGQLFVDATGEDAALIGQSPHESWRDQFPVDRVLMARAPAFTSIPPFAEVRISKTGWTMLHPSRVATGIVHAYSSNRFSDDAACAAAATVSGAKLDEVVCRTVSQGVRSSFWEGNCVAVGEAACRLDPLHDVDLHALQLGIVHLVSLFPVCEAFAAERVEYNRLMRSHYERIRDFQCAYYALATREVKVPDSLAHKIATFRACGHVPPMEDETFSAESWQALLIGLGVFPEHTSPAIERIPSSRFNEDFARMLAFIKAKVLEQPTHDSYLESLLRQVAA